MEDNSVQVISREVVKPSSNDHPTTLKRSYLDQLHFLNYVHILLFYQANESISTSNHAQISQNLKNSLSHTLSSFYPLAGRPNAEDNTVVDCNDAGIEFIEARAHAHLTDALESLDGKLYVPLDVAIYSSALDLTQKPFLFLQLTFFECGGIALGISFSHFITDGSSIMMFINAWASISRSKEIPQVPCFDSANYFPPRVLPEIGYRAPDKEAITGIKTNMLLFDGDKIAALKQKAISSSTVKDPTRVEVISAFIWKCMIEIEKKSTFVMHPVNIRGRASSFNLKNTFGNCFMTSPTYADDGVVEFHDLVNKLRRSMRKIDDAYIKESQNGDTYVNDVYKMYSAMLSMGETEGYGCSCWSRFPFYKVDFGFGTPVLFHPVLVTHNCVILVSTKTEESIQVWVSLEQHKFDMIEHQLKLISTTTV